MKHSNISVFIPHIGCPNMCSFCNQHTISGAQKAPTAEEVNELCRRALGEVSSPENTEIAFFGGSFTAIGRSYMISLLQSVQEFIGQEKFSGIRISTRPDCIDREVLELLKNYNVTAIELGAQSMSDTVLNANDRGHTAQEVIDACALIRKYGFELGLQMMVGLYRSNAPIEYDTFVKIADIRPDTLRIYPVVILEGTRLGELYKSGEFVPMDFDEVVSLCAHFLKKSEELGIKGIKCGLHASECVEKEMLGGFYHPSFRELCESELYRLKMKGALEFEPITVNEAVFAVNPSCISKALGHKKSNFEYFKNKGINIKIVGDENVTKYECYLKGVS